jgi:glycosyltransferase involved in cell wall biosynthesis
MAAGRPVLAAVDPDCDTARVIEEGGFGRVVRPADAGILARAILELRGSPDLLAGWGRRAREAFVRSYSKEHNVDRYADLLSAVASGR